jgi:hypothetical protein
VDLLVSKDHFDILTKLAFLRNVWLLGKGNIVFEPIREILLLGNISTALVPLVRQSRGPGDEGRGLGWSGKDAEMVRAMCLALEENVRSFVPNGITESMVSVDMVSEDGASDNSSLEQQRQLQDKRRPQPRTVLMIDYFVQSLSMQLHLTVPLVEVISGGQITMYNASFKALLRVHICLWSAEILWKKVTNSHLTLSRFSSQSLDVSRGGNRRGDGDGHVGASCVLSDPRQMFSNCASGIQWILHITKALHSFYLHHLHDTHLCVLEASIGRAQSVADLKESHHQYVTSCYECLHFLSSIVEGLLFYVEVYSGLYAMGRLDEAFVTAEATVVGACDEDSLDDTYGTQRSSARGNDIKFSAATIGILKSRLDHTSRAFSSARDRIKDLICTLDDITSDTEPFSGKSGKSIGVLGERSTSGSDAVDTSKTMAWHLSLRYAQSLKALVGDGAGARLRSGNTT